MLEVGKKYPVRSEAFEAAIMEQFDTRELALHALASWAPQLALDSKNFLDVTLTASGCLEFVAVPGSNVGAVAGGMYNFAIHFNKTTRCKFNGYTMEIKSNGE